MVVILVLFLFWNCWLNSFDYLNICIGFLLYKHEATEIICNFFFDWINNEAQKVYDRAEQRKKWMLFLVKHGCWFFILCRWQQKKKNTEIISRIWNNHRYCSWIDSHKIDFKAENFYVLCVCVGYFKGLFDDVPWHEIVPTFIFSLL